MAAVSARRRFRRRLNNNTLNEPNSFDDMCDCVRMNLKTRNLKI